MIDEQMGSFSRFLNTKSVTLTHSVAASKKILPVSSGLSARRPAQSDNSADLVF